MSRHRLFVESHADLEPNSYSLQKFFVYKTQAMFYLVGRDKTRSKWRILKIDRSEPNELNIYEDPTVYSEEGCKDILNILALGNERTGGLNFVTKAYGIVGFIKFLEPYYMILVTKRRLVGRICGHSIYGISQSLLLTIPHSTVLTAASQLKAENGYKKLFTSIDLTKDFFYSYTYRIMWTLQKNSKASKFEKIPYENMFVWNTFLTQAMRDQIGSTLWTVSLIHGFFKQVKLSFGNVNFALTLIARRSRHFAGTRYLKRGVNVEGRVANDVETEQIVNEEPFGSSSQISSVVQHRGSIPLFWSQKTSILSPKPDIVLQDNTGYNATRLHFENLEDRYGNPITVLNLVKTVEKKAREKLLCKAFATSVARLNHSLPKAKRIKFIQWDFHMFTKRKSTNVLEVLDSIALDALDSTGFYYSGRPNNSSANNDAPNSSNQNADESSDEGHNVGSTYQQGVLRSNCIDCLDRTNVAQYAFGLAALGHQMHALGLCNVPRVASNSILAVILMEMYENMGDALAMQYGGSTAHNKVFSQHQGKWKATIQSMEFFRSLWRHYNNAYLDGDKQNAINIFLGHFRPKVDKLDQWQLEHGYRLQGKESEDNAQIELRLSVKKSMSDGNMTEHDKSTMLTDTTLKSHAFTVKSSPQSQLERIESQSQTIEIEKDGLINNDDLENGDANSFLIPGSQRRSIDSRCLSDCAGFESLSSSGNSCEEDAQERHPPNESEAIEENEYFQDLTSAMLSGSYSYTHTRDGRMIFAEDPLADNLLQEHDVSSGTTRIRAGVESLAVFSERFVDWVHKGETLLLT